MSKKPVVSISVGSSKNDPAPVNLPAALLSKLESHPGASSSRSKKKKKGKAAGPASAHTQSQAVSVGPVGGGPVGRGETRKMLRLIACPDELETYALERGQLPILPTSSSSRRFPHGASVMQNAGFRNTTLAIVAPSQTTYAARISATGSYGGAFTAGSYLALNMAREDMAWTITQAGVPMAATQGTKRLVPGLHMGVLLATDSAEPAIPMAVSYSATGPNDGVYFMVTDGVGQYSLVRMTTPNRFVMMVIGDVTLVPTAGSAPSATYPASGFTTPVGTGSVPLFVNPMPFTTGALVREALTLQGAPENAPGDTTFAPCKFVCGNVRVVSMTSALQPKFAVSSYAIGSGRSGPYHVLPGIDPTTATSGFMLTTAVLAQRCQQHTLGSLNPDNEDWSSVNLAARLNGVNFAEDLAIYDLAYASCPEGVDTLTTQAYVPAQGGASAPQLCNVPGVGFGETTISMTMFRNGNTTAGQTYPVQLFARALFEFELPSDTGFPTVEPQFDPAFVRGLQALMTYPTLATAHSFKDFLKTVWGGARKFAGQAGSVLKPLAKQAALDAVLAVLG